MCSLLTKVDIIAAELSNFDIIAISETHLDSSIDNNSLIISGFHPPIRLDRNRNGGGVAMYISDEFVLYERKDLQSNNLEILWSEIHLTNKKFLECVLYKPPNSLVDYWNIFCSNIEKVLECNLPFFSLGDLKSNFCLIIIKLRSLSYSYKVLVFQT